MGRYRWGMALVLLIGAWFLARGSHGVGADAAARVTCRQNTKTVPPYEVFEITFRHEGKHTNPFLDASVEVVFTAPSGKRIVVGGFHYGSLEKPEIQVEDRTPDGWARRVRYLFAKADTWKARFAPADPGAWRYQYTFTCSEGVKVTGTGTLQCVASRAPHPGFVRQDPENAHRWVFDDGTPYYPIGLQDGWGDGRGTGSFLAGASLEGPWRMDMHGKAPPQLPAGAVYKRGPSMNPQNAEVYFRKYSQAGFNLFRFSQRNNTPALFTDLDRYAVQEAIMTDELLRCAHRHGLRVFYGIFGFGAPSGDHPEDAAEMAKVKRFVKYTVDRWGALVDFWQLLNETKADARWIADLAAYIHEIDPYHHPVTTSWERPEVPGINVNAPHWYDWYGNELNADEVTAANAERWKKAGKPVIVGEHGNMTNREKPVVGIGGVWDPTSAVRMRVRNWTALFHEIALVFWNTSYAKDGHFMNIWLGPREREYVRAMQCFAACLGRGVRIAPVEVTDAKVARAYALASGKRAGVYVHHYADHKSTVRGLIVALDVPKAGMGYWYRPEDAAVLGRFRAPAGRGSFVVPGFAVDMALLLTPDGPPDVDGDGQPNDADADNDNDGVPNLRDAFPLEPEERADTDGDAVGDSMDADRDGDGKPNDDNKNGIPDFQEMDLDGDGIPRAHAVPFDAFPLNPKECRDADGDGIGDNADPDKDGDGFTNSEEKRARTDPMDPLSFPVTASRARGRTNRG